MDKINMATRKLKEKKKNPEYSIYKPSFHLLDLNIDFIKN